MTYRYKSWRSDYSAFRWLLLLVTLQIMAVFPLSTIDPTFFEDIKFKIAKFWFSLSFSCTKMTARFPIRPLLGRLKIWRHGEEFILVLSNVVLCNPISRHVPIRGITVCCAQHNSSILVKRWSQKPEATRPLQLHYIFAVLSILSVSAFARERLPSGHGLCPVTSYFSANLVNTPTIYLTASSSTSSVPDFFKYERTHFASLRSGLRISSCHYWFSTFSSFPS